MTITTDETIWTPSKQSQLLELNKLNLSAATIAAKLGTTRNAVLGKLWRARVSNAPLEGMQPRPSHKLQAPLIPPPPNPPYQINVFNLEPHHCKWPLGDPRAKDFTFCGHTRFKDRPYCEFHWQMQSAKR